MALFDKLDQAILQNIHVDHNVHTDPKLQDSLEIGSSAKGGVIKVYGDFSNPEQFKAKLEQAIQLKEFANSRIYGNTSDKEI